jgi:FG-GAP repeat
MNTRSTLALFLAGAACLLLAACQADEEAITETTFRSLVKLVPSDPADADGFGMSMDVEAGCALVGSPGEDADGSNRGAAYLFLQNQGGLDGWGQVKKLVASAPEDGQIFGVSVALSGNCAVVGAPGDNGTGTDQGAVYVFYKDQGGVDNWGQVTKIRAADAADDDGFGYAVALEGDTLVVGSDGEDGSGTDRGAVYVFYRDRGGADNWGQVAKLTAGDPQDVDQFGFAVALSGDVIVVGAPGDDGNGIARGSAYVFSRDLGGADAWGQLKKIGASDAADDVWFGTSVALDGTVAVVGAAWDDANGTNRGAAYIFARGQGGADNWGELKKLTASDGGNSDLFGYAVAVDGSFIVVGAAWNDGGGSERGQAYVFFRDEGGTDNWGELQRLRAGDGANEDHFGFAVRVDGLTILAGATGEDGEGVDRGAAYMFRKVD